MIVVQDVVGMNDESLVLKKERNYALDLIRSLAILFVFVLHCLQKLGFYKTNYSGKWMFVYTCIRWTAYSCVPLFLLLTGYLQNKKQLNKKFYKSIVRVIVSYLVIAVITILVLDTNKDKKFIEYFVSVFNFSAIGYGWYIPMYIGLFLLIPFLNRLYSNLSQKEKKILIFTLLFLTSLKLLFSSIEILDVKLNVGVNYWTIIYPITYYFIGAYISEFRPKINKKYAAILFVVYIVILSLITYKNFIWTTFDWNFLGDYSCITTVITSVLIFLILYDVNIKNNIIRKALRSVSEVSLDMYLFSYIYDNILYDALKTSGNLSIKNLIIMVTIIFTLTYLSAIIKKYILRIFTIFGLQIKSNNDRL